jgi:hypothetical protein
LIRWFPNIDIFASPLQVAKEATLAAPFRCAFSEAPGAPGDSGDSDFDEALQWAVMTVLDDMMQLKYGSMDTWTSGLRVVTAATLETWDGTFGKRLLRKHGLCFQSKISTCSTVQRLAAASSSKSWL